MKPVKTRSLLSLLLLFSLAVLPGCAVFGLGPIALIAYAVVGGGGDDDENGGGGTAIPAMELVSIDPASGKVAGGTTITLTGTGFQAGATVDFGGVSALSVTVVSTTTITCDTPAHSAGPVDVTVTNPDNESDVLVGGFIYSNPPQLGAPTGPGTIGGTAPHFTSTVSLGASLDFTIQATDPDASDTLAFTAVVSGGTVTAAQAGFVTTFPNTANGTSPQTLAFNGTAVSTGAILIISFTVSDGNGGSATGSLTLTISGPPAIGAPDGPGTVQGSDPSYHSQIRVGDDLAFSIEATDVDGGDNLTFTATETGGTGILSAVNAGFSTTFPHSTSGNSPQTLSFTGTAANPGTFQITFSVDDGNGGTDFVNFVINISPAQGPVIYVDKDATGNNNGASWADAYNVIQDAVDNATSGDELWIAGGTYHRRTVFDNEVIAMVGGVNIFGGFVGTETSRDDRDWTANPTILDGESAVDHVVVAYRNARIDGFTITAGLADGSVNERNGGGMLINRHDTVVANCTFTGNSANNYGGAIYTYDGDFRPTIINCTFTGNSGWHGGAIYASSDSPIIIDCVFESNSGTGGAIRNGSPYASGCIFRKNGTWAVYSGHCNFYNCIFAGNKGATGGACNIGDGSEIVNCTFTGNKGSQGGAIYSNGTTGFIKNCIFWGNTAPTDPDLYGGIPVSYCAIENGGTFADGGNNLTGQDPLFVTDGYWDDNGTPGDGNDDFWVNGDYHLRSSSPCKNVGTNADAPSNDLDGNPRPSGSGVDMGAYEYQE